MLMVSLVVGGRQELFIKKERYLFFSLILQVYTVCSCLADILIWHTPHWYKGSQIPSRNISEFMQQEGRWREEVGKMLVCDKCDIRLLVTCCALILAKYFCVLVIYKKVCLKEGKVWWKVFSNKTIFMLSHTFCHLLSPDASPVSWVQ